MTAKIKYTAPYELKKGHEGDSCFDLCAWFDDEDQLYSDYHFRLILPGQTLLILTGVRFDIPEGYEVQIRPRSGQSRDGLLAHFGTIDSGYTGEVAVIITNLSSIPVSIRQGDRVAQAFIGKVPDIVLDKIDRITKVTERGEHGFGSTGR